MLDEVAERVHGSLQAPLGWLPEAQAWGAESCIAGCAAARRHEGAGQSRQALTGPVRPGLPSLEASRC